MHQNGLRGTNIQIMPSFFDDNEQCDVVPLITCTDGKYTVDSDTLAWIEEKRGGFGIIACAGRYRTGKSFLLNRLAQAGSGNGFGVGDSVQACTKGLWIYKKWFKTDDADKDILFMDTEGIDALDANDTHDVRVFTLALLLSSAFLYNSVGAIDETAMQTLSLMTRVTENVKVQSNTEDADVNNLAQHMPAFFWILRDFSLRLVDKEGKSITVDQYLENALQTSDPQKDQVRGAIRGAFQRRKLVTLPRPTNDDGNMTHLESRLMSVTPKFTKEVAALRKMLFQAVKPFTAQGKIASGRMYGALCTHLASVVQSDAVPVMRDSWTLMAAVQARDLKDNCMADFENALTKQPRQRLDLVERSLQALKCQILSLFNDRALPPVDEATRDALEKAIDARLVMVRPTLVKDFVEDAEKILRTASADTVADVKLLKDHIEACATSFFKEVQVRDASTENAWMVAVGNVVTKWLPQIDEAHSRELATIARRVDTLCHEREALRTELDAAKEIPAAFKVRECELEQINESRQKECAALHLKTDRLEQEIIVLATECRRGELLIDSLNREKHTHDAGSERPEAISTEETEEIDAINLKCVQLESELRSERNALALERKTTEEMKTRLEKSAALHAKLETSWKSGLEDLKRNELKQRSILEEKIQLKEKEKESLKQELSEANEAIANLRDVQQKMESKEITIQELHENEKMQLRDVAQKHRDQCEASQQRVLEIHRSMLEDLRVRDDRARELNSVHLKERAELQSRLTETTQELERTKDMGAQTKRRLIELEAIERDSKRLKAQQQSDSVIITRLEAENEQLKCSTTQMTEDRDRLRQENMSMEGELALLRAEKQLNDARRCITGED